MQDGSTAARLSSQVKPALLSLFERYYVPLGRRAVPCQPGLILALLTAMEDVVRPTPLIDLTLTHPRL